MFKLRLFCGLLLISLCFAAPAFALYPEIPRISIDDLKAMIDAGEPVLILDTQPEMVYDMGHIAGSVSFPWRETVAFNDVRAFPRDVLIVTYCECGPGESDSAHMANLLKMLGFRNVSVLEDPSYTGWHALGYPVEDNTE